MYETELKELGLTDNEIKVYLALLEKGLLNPTKLAEITGLHRSYIYDTLDRLMEKGIVNTVLVNNKKNYQAVDPKALRAIYELKLKQLDTILPKLSALFHETKDDTKIELHKGKRVYRTLIKDLIASSKVNSEVLLIGVNEEHLMSEVEPIYLKQYFTIIKEKNIKERVILKKSSKRFTIPNVTHKFLEDKHVGTTEQVIYSNKVAIFIPSNPYYLIIIDNKQVADTYRKQFELLWSIAK